MATMSSLGLKVASSPNAILDKSQFTGSFESPRVARFNRQLNVRAQLQQDEAPTQSRRAMFGVLLAAAGVLAVDQESRALTDIKINGPPPPSGGLPGTENADQPRDLDLPLKDRSFLQPVTPAEAVNRIKDASKDIVGVKELIEKKSWPYVRNDLRSKATYLRYDLTTILSSKSKEERKEIKKLTSKLFDVMDKLDFAARMKDPIAAEQSYNDTVAALDDVIAKISA